MIPSPPGLAYTSYQTAGVLHLTGRPGALLADEPGLGKTIQVAGALNLCTLPRLSVLVVCPATLTLNWMSELRRWLVHPRRIGIGSSEGLPGSEICIVNYDVIHRPAVLQGARSRAWDVIVYDEAHYIKTPEAKRTLAALNLLGSYHWALTGTPVLNRPIEAYAPLWWISRGQILPYGQYAMRYCSAFLETKPRKGKGAKPQKSWNVQGASNLPELHTYLLQLGMLRRRKVDVLSELPAKRHQLIQLSPGPVTPLILQEQRMAQALGYAELLRRLEVGVPVPLEGWAQTRHQLALAKVEPAAQFIADALEEEPCVFVVAHHRDVVDGLASRLRPFGVVRIVGGMSVAEKDRARAAFQAGEARVLIGNEAAREGITLTAASRMICVELDPVPGNMQQYEDRLHRFGQRGSVLIQHLVFDGSLDVQIARKLMRKKDIISQAVDGFSNPQGV